MDSEDSPKKPSYVMALYVVIMILIVLIVIQYCDQPIVAKAPTEDYRACFGCNDDYRMIDGGMSVINPVIWPYSATTNIDPLYSSKKQLFGFTNQPLINQFTPDHVVMT
jgi:hypothetical protein